MLEGNFAFAIVNSEFPHVAQRLEDHWMEPDFGAVMDELLNQENRREGFPRGVFTALRSLALMHDMEVQSNCFRV